MLADVGEETSLTFDSFETNIVLPADNGHNKQVPDQDQTDQCDIPVEPCRSTCVPQPTKASLQSMEYQKHEVEEKGTGQDWATGTRNSKVSMVIDCMDDNDNVFTCLADTKIIPPHILLLQASHSYRPGTMDITHAS